MGIGLLRLLFALSIVITHTSKIWGFNFVDSIVAVESFYIISGFYMALILNEKYHKLSSFFVNRFLRLYPMYLVVLGLTLLLGVSAILLGNSTGPLASYVTHVRTLHPLTLLTLMTTNLVLIGQDIMMFFAVNTHGILYFTGNFKIEALPAHVFLLISQAWTIGLELTFYLFAPFLVKLKNATLIVLLFLSLWLRWYLGVHGLSDDPWSYRFFPLELALFIVGILSYKIYRVLMQIKKPVNGLVSGSAVLLLLSFITLFQYIPVLYVMKQWSYYTLLMLLLPLAFLHSRKNTFDRNVGDLSYPIYISHVTLAEAVRILFPWLYSYLTMYHINAYAVFIFLVSVGFSWILLAFVQNPIERIRSRLAQNQYREK